MTEQNPDESGNDIDDEMLNILAAFGDDALDMLDDDDDFGDLGDLGEASSVEHADNPENTGLPKLIRPETDCNAVVTDDLCTRLARKYGDRINEDSSLAYAGSIAMACSRAVDAPPRVDFRCVVFEAGNQTFGIPLDGVIEIARRGRVTALPRTPRWLCGVTNLRGQIFSVIDLASRLQPEPESLSGRPSVTLPTRPDSSSGKMIFVRGSSQQTSTAILVHRVLGIRGFTRSSEDLSGHSPATMSVASGLAAVDSRDPLTSTQSSIVLIDPNKLLESTTLTA